MHSCYSDDFTVQRESAVHAEGGVVLCYLEVLWEVRIEVGLPGEPCRISDPASEELGDLNAHLESPAVQSRPRAGESEAGRADRFVRSIAGSAAGTEELRGGWQLEMYLKVKTFFRESLKPSVYGLMLAIRDALQAGIWPDDGRPIRAIFLII